VPQSYERAADWYRKAAEQGEADVQYALGLAYKCGIGASEDNVLAHMLFSLAAKAGHAEASDELAELTEQLTPEQLSEARALAAGWKPNTPLPTETKTGRP
jgi:TPR repeat protein